MRRIEQISADSSEGTEKAFLLFQETCRDASNGLRLAGSPLAELSIEIQETDAIRLYRIIEINISELILNRFKDKYRTESLRLKGYDYSQEGLYFITICTKNRIHYFGKIENGKMQLNPAGEIAAAQWIKSEKVRERVQLGEWIIMPNHVHGIIYLKPKTQCRDASNASPRDGYTQEYSNKFGPQSGNISAIIRGYKSACTKLIKKSGYRTFHWQKGFYDHIIRNQKSLMKIEEYIRENPLKWHNDRYYSK